MIIEPYSVEIEKQMQELYSRLPEKSRRLYAGIEALKFSYGGISYSNSHFDPNPISNLIRDRDFKLFEHKLK